MANIMRVGGGGGVNQFKLKIQYPDGVSDITCNLCGEDGSLTEIFEGQVLSEGQIVHTSTTEEGYSGNVYYVPAVTDEFVVTVGTHLNATTLSGRLDDYSWEEIIYFANVGVASDMFEVGDTKTMELLDGTETEFKLVGILHDDNADQTNKLQLTFHSSVLYPTSYQLNSENLYTSYLNYDAVTTYLPLILTNFPSYMQTAIKCPYKNFTYNSANTTIVFGSFNNQKLWLPSSWEIINEGQTAYANYQDGNQYAYYRDSENFRIKNAEGVYSDILTRTGYGSSAASYNNYYYQSIIDMNNTYGYAYLFRDFKTTYYYYCLGFCL